jgi:hypothetical protein
MKKFFLPALNSAEKLVGPGFSIMACLDECKFQSFRFASLINGFVF